MILTALVPLGFVTGMSLPANAVTAQTSVEDCRVILAQPKGVLFIGDSITEMGFATITAQFTAAGKHVCISGLGGRATASGVDVLATYVAAGVLQPNTQIVMALGTNDVLGRSTAMQKQITRALALVGNHRVIWVKVYNATGYFGPWGRTLCMAGSIGINKVIDANVKTHNNMVSVDWWGMVYLTNGRLIDWTNNGGVHPTPTGNYYRTVMILAKTV